MKIKYIHVSDPTTEKIYDTEIAFHNPSNPKVFNTQEEFDKLELMLLEADKKQGIIISYEIIA